MTRTARRVEITRHDKVLFPQSGITKGDLVEYYRHTAGVILPHLYQRPISMLRYPNGIEREGFYQKDAPDYFPDWIPLVRIEKEKGMLCQVICNDPATLVFLANQACITPHVWLSRVDHLHCPDRLVIDLDPAAQDFKTVCEAAQAVRRVLAELGLKSFVMTTGSRGLHVTVPIVPELDFDEVRDFARRLSEILAARYPDRLTTEHRKQARGERLYLDIMRNAYAQTAVPPYAVRPIEDAPVATPLVWPELTDSALHPQSYTIRNIARRLASRPDPWHHLDDERQSLREAEDRLRHLEAELG